MAAAGFHGHALAILRMAVDGRGDLHGTLGEVAPGERRVGALDPALLDGAREPAVREVGLGDEQQPRRIPIEPVHNAGPARRPDRRQRRAAADEHVDERVVPVARPGMHDETRRLVEHREVLVLVDETHPRALSGGDRCICARWRFGGKLDAHLRAALEQRRGAQRPAAGGDALVGDETGGLGAGQGELVGEKAIEALRRGDRDAKHDHGAAVPASFARSCARPSSHREMASATAPTVIAESATLKVGQR